MKNVILSAIVALTLASGVAFATGYDYSGGVVAGSQGSGEASSGGNGRTGGTVTQSSTSQAYNETGATASSVKNGDKVDVTATTRSAGFTVQSSQTTQRGNAQGSTGSLAVQGGSANANADGSVRDRDGTISWDGNWGTANASGDASVSSKSAQGSGGLTFSSGNGKSTYGTDSYAGNASYAGVEVDADASRNVTGVQLSSYGESFGGNGQIVNGTQRGNAFGVAGAIGGQEGSAQGNAGGGIVFGQATGWTSGVAGAGQASNASNADVKSGGVVFGVNGGDARSITNTGSWNGSNSGVVGTTTPDNSLTSVNTWGNEGGGSNSNTVNRDRGFAGAIGGGNATNSGYGNGVGGFSTYGNPQ